MKNYILTIALFFGMAFLSDMISVAFHDPVPEASVFFAIVAWVFMLGFAASVGYTVSVYFGKLKNDNLREETRYGQKKW